MLYLSNTPEAQELAVPKNVEVPSGELSFRAKSTIDLATEIDLNVVDLSISDLYMHLAVTVPAGIPVGEYEYTVSVDGDVLATGLLMVGEFGRADEYEKPITYDQYDAE